MFNFRDGVNKKYDQIRSQILNRDPFPALMQSYVARQGEESRRNVMVNAPFQERKAMAVNPQDESMKIEEIEKGRKKCNILKINVGKSMDVLLVDEEEEVISTKHMPNVSETPWNSQTIETFNKGLSLGNFKTLED